eukprot:CAMPEP_0179171026 /NCGR_PEP_ID=MMETSP0796-20121207/84286_1 /TAXON_ID=73915 /ORGANISM="Pyrodinium bahamense, Strain pbaha01" /LENGTH=51 /DNA_ID=CAMNT_0020874061 /DNA_START=9 /DNA_END=161 /DNA_ORIENTATION=+
MKGQATALDMRQQLFYTDAVMRHIKKSEASLDEKMERLLDMSASLLSRHMP